MLRRHQPPEFVPHDLYLLDDVEDSGRTACDMYAGTADQLLRPLVFGHHSVGENHMAAMLDCHSCLSACTARLPSLDHHVG